MLSILLLVILIIQLLREWPPGFGGVERVAHELGVFWRGDVFSFDAQRHAHQFQDPLQVPYRRQRLRVMRLVGRLQIPLPSKSLAQLLFSKLPLLGHLPSPGVLLLLLLARVLSPKRKVVAYWHCFLDTSSGLKTFPYALYQWFALCLVRHFSAVVTTSPLLATELHRCGCPRQRIFVLPCCISQHQEQVSLSLPVPDARDGDPLRLLFIGRLDSYKRLDWLFESLLQLTNPWRLTVVGDGPKRSGFEEMSKLLFAQPLPVHFLGRLSESAKFEQIAAADLLVLPSSSSNEAFGLVQLEAMAAARISLAFDQPRSGMSWVSTLPGLPWSSSRHGLAEVLQQLAELPDLRRDLCVQARERYLKLFARSVWLRTLHRFNDYVEGGIVFNPVE